MVPEYCAEGGLALSFFFQKRGGSEEVVGSEGSG